MENVELNGFGVKVSTVLECLNNTRLCNKTVFAAKYPDDYKAIESFVFPVRFTFTQKMYHVLHDDFELNLYKKCGVCGKPCKFRTINTGYSEYCSRACSSTANGKKISKSLKSKTRNEWDAIIKKRVDAYHAHTDEEKRNFFEKRKQTNKKRYGVENYNNTKKAKETLLNKTEEEKEQRKKKTQETWKNKTQEEINNIVKKASKTREETCLKKYGAKNIMQTSKGKKSLKNSIKNRTPEQKKRLKENRIHLARKQQGVQNKDFVGYCNNGVIHCICANKTCTMCKDKMFFTNKEEYKKRMGLNEEVCTKLNPSPNQETCKTVDFKNTVWLMRCTNNLCNLCSHGFYETPPSIYRDRTRLGFEPCTILNPIGRQDSGEENTLYEYIRSIYGGYMEKKKRVRFERQGT